VELVRHRRCSPRLPSSPFHPPATRGACLCSLPPSLDSNLEREESVERQRGHKRNG
jgi:hypothetical protein